MYYTVTVTGRLTTGADSVEAIALTVKYPGGDVPRDVCPHICYRINIHIHGVP